MNIRSLLMAKKMGGGTGLIDPKRLPEGYPYREQSEIVFLDITCTESGNYELGDFSWLEAGKTYTVQFGNETFEIMAEAGTNTSLFGGNYVYLGCTITTGGPKGDYPFSIYRADKSIGYGACVLKEQPAEPIKIKVLSDEIVIHTMTPEFLPGPVILYYDDDEAYLYANEADTADISKRLTYTKVRDMLLFGRNIFVQVSFDNEVDTVVELAQIVGVVVGKNKEFNEPYAYVSAAGGLEAGLVPDIEI